VAEGNGPEGREILGVGRLIKEPGTHDGEVAVIISDAWQNRGLGSELVSRLLQVARDEKLHRLKADILPENHEMLHLVRSLGFTIEQSSDSPILHAELSV